MDPGTLMLADALKKLLEAGWEPPLYFTAIAAPVLAVGLFAIVHTQVPTPCSLFRIMSYSYHGLVREALSL
jgi:hypothetical protein